MDGGGIRLKAKGYIFAGKRFHRSADERVETPADIQQDKARCEYEAKSATASHNSGNGIDGMTSAMGAGVGDGIVIAESRLS